VANHSRFYVKQLSPGSSTRDVSEIQSLRGCGLTDEFWSESHIVAFAGRVCRENDFAFHGFCWFVLSKPVPCRLPLPETQYFAQTQYSSAKAVLIDPALINSASAFEVHCILKTDEQYLLWKSCYILDQ